MEQSYKTQAPSSTRDHVSANVLAIFDFDGTITRGDSFYAALRYVTSGYLFIWKMVTCLPVIGLYLAGLISNGYAKQYVFNRFFRGKSEKDLDGQMQKFTETTLEAIIRPQARRVFESHIASGHSVVVLSATPDIILNRFCTVHKLILIATRAEIIDHQLTGRFATPNCHGTEKVRRLEAQFDLARFDYIYAYGNSNSDMPFLNVADKAYYKPFRSTELSYDITAGKP